MKRVLVVVATTAEARRLDAVQAPGAQLQVLVSGVGPVAAALATQAALQVRSADLVISAGIGGAFPESGLKIGDVAIASCIVQADLGAWDGEAFLPLETLGLEVAPGNPGHFACWRPIALDLPTGPFVTVCSATGSAAGALRLARQVPGVLIESMEGAGVAHAALRSGVPSTEVRGVSNFVGPRQRAAWQIPQALAALEGGLQTLLAAFIEAG